MRFFSVTAAFHFVPRFEFIESNTDLLTPRLADPVGAVLLAIVALLLRTGLFINPPAPGLEGDYTGNPQYEIGSTITLEWSTSWSNIELDLLQENTKENARSLLGKKTFRAASGITTNEPNHFQITIPTPASMYTPCPTAASISGAGEKLSRPSSTSAS